MLLKKSWDKVRVATQQSHQSRDERKLVSLLFWEMMDSDPRWVGRPSPAIREARAAAGPPATRLLNGSFCQVV